MGTIRGNTKIAGSYTVAEWKDLRVELIKALHEKKHDTKELWNNAFNIFRERVDTRFLRPIDHIIGMSLNTGEGFAAVALQCILVEFFESFYQGKIYSPPFPNQERNQNLSKETGIDIKIFEKHLQPNEYRNSSNLFNSFLRNREPFKKYRASRNIADGFYATIRCGLLHEAATKEDSIIKNEKDDIPFEKRGKRNIVLYRNNFQKDLKLFLDYYRDELFTNKNLQFAFIRKMDDLCQLKKDYYFAYGSNLNKDRMNDRGFFFHETFVGYMENYSLIFNKKSVSQEAMANIQFEEDSLVWGVCYEIDADHFERLKSIEQGYDIKNAVIRLQDNHQKFIIAKTFISSNLTNHTPNKLYINLIVEGAREHNLPESYIDRIEKKAFPNSNNIFSFERKTNRKANLSNFFTISASVKKMEETVAAMFDLLNQLEKKPSKNHSIDDNEIKSYVTSLIVNQRFDINGLKGGSWCVARDIDGMPGDARVEFVFFPTYIAISILTKIILDFSQIAADFPSVMQSIRTGLQFACYRQLEGHGYDSTHEKIKAIEILGKGKVPLFMISNSDICPEFYNILLKIKNDANRRLKNNATKGAWGEDYSDGYRSISNILNLL